MRFADQLKFFFASFVPGSYRAQTAKHFPAILQGFFFSLTMILVLMLVLSCVYLLRLPSFTSSAVGEFDTFTLSAQASSHSPVVLLQSPRIVIDTTGSNVSEYLLLMTNDGIWSQYLWFESFTAWDDIKDVSANADRYGLWLTVLALLLIPSLFVVLFVVACVESLVLACVAWCFFGLFTKLSRFRISAKHLLKVCVVALIPFLALEMVPFVYVRWFWIPFVFYMLLVGAAVWYVGEKGFKKE